MAFSKKKEKKKEKLQKSLMSDTEKSIEHFGVLN